jgi:ubiquinone/menaquinone biosynthesis C-methylase UbiE
MIKRTILLTTWFLITTVLHAQQKPRKGINFCGWRMNDTAAIRQAYANTLSFMNIRDRDTIVDVGSSSGSLEGVLSVAGDFQHVHFVLVDVDSNCLNRRMVDNMLAFYSEVKGSPISHQFSIVNNTPDSLFLPLDRYQHSWIINTIHEIPDKAKMARDIAGVLQKGGELIVMELVARPKHVIHGGCNQPLLDEQELKTLFEQNGFVQAATKTWYPAKKARNPYYLVRFIKS